MTNNKQQTAVEWLIAEIQRRVVIIQSEPQTMTRELMIENLGVDLDTYKEMEKEMTIKLYADYENYLEEAFKNQCGGQAVILSFQEFYEQRYGGSEQ